VLRALGEGPRSTRQLDVAFADVALARREEVLASLQRDGLVAQRGRVFLLAGSSEAPSVDARTAS
jgi:hypothetical protein